MPPISRPEQFANRVAEHLREEQRSVAWLAREANIKPETLRYQLANPGSILLRNALAVSAVTGVDIGDAA